MSTELLTVKEICKSFPGVLALDKVSLHMDGGEVLALVGENGAGKSTLIKIISGVYAPDAGEILVCGEPIREFRPGKALRLGINTIFQDLNLVNSLSVAKNIMLGREPRQKMPFLVDFATMNKRATNYLAELGQDIEPTRLVSDLSISEKQMVEIAKSLSANNRILIMDEPTSSLTPREIDALFAIIRRLKGRGVGIVFISHRLNEVIDISDRVVVLRDGRKVAELKTIETSAEQIVVHMVGENLIQQRARTGTPDQDKVLEVKSISAHRQFRDISFDLHKGEILGLTGLLGSGQMGIAHALSGLVPLDKGEILVDGVHLSQATPAEPVKAGIGLVPEDRKRLGLVLPLDVRENISAPNQDQLARWGVRNFRKEVEMTSKYITDLNIRCAGQSQQVMFLSGGNQQKVVIAKWLAKRPRVLILHEPTHGIDVKTKAEIANTVRGLANEGIAVLLISSEIDELLGLCDRIMVMREGHVVDVMDIREATKDRITRSMMGVRAGTPTGGLSVSA